MTKVQPKKAVPKKTVGQMVSQYEEELFKRLQKQVVKVVRANSLLSGNYANAKLRIGLLTIDTMLGGGLKPGSWYTSFGLEQSGKSTLAAQAMIAAYRARVPIVHFWDYEGSTGGDMMYLARQFQASGVKDPLDDIMGDAEEAKPISYWAEDVLETCFDTLASLLRKMPDRQCIDGRWYYIFNDDKYGREMTDGRHDKGIKSKFGRLAIEGHANAMGGLVLLDSYPAMNPRSMDVDDAKAGMALQARAFSENIRRIRGKLRSKGLTIVGVNQLRLKPGVIYGSPEYESCFIGETKVLLADGTSKTIRDIVENRLPVEVLSFDKETGLVSSNKVIGWKDNGTVPQDQLVKVKYKAYDRNTCPVFCDFTCTRSHNIWTTEGMVAAGDLRTGSKVFLNWPCRNENGVVQNRLLVTEVVEVEPGNLDTDFVRVYDLTVENNHTYFVGGVDTAGGDFKCDSVAVSNCGEAVKFASDCRIRCSSISNPWGDGRIQQEESVDGDGSDSYQHMKYRLIKNKVGGLNNVEVFQRIWVADKNGDAHGFDRVGDAYRYLELTGQLKGTRAKFMIEGSDIKTKKPLNFATFKRMILGNKDQQHKIQLDTGLIAKKDKPINLRVLCAKQIEAGKTASLVKHHASSGSKGT